MLQKSPQSALWSCRESVLEILKMMENANLEQWAFIWYENETFVCILHELNIKINSDIQINVLTLKKVNFIYLRRFSFKFKVKSS